MKLLKIQQEENTTGVFFALLWASSEIAMKIEIIPKPPIDIIISKNKASEFKQWLDS